MNPTPPKVHHPPTWPSGQVLIKDNLPFKVTVHTVLQPQVKVNGESKGGIITTPCPPIFQTEG